MAVGNISYAARVEDDADGDEINHRHSVIEALDARSMDIFKRLTRFTKRRRRLAKLLLAPKPIREAALIVGSFGLLGDVALLLASKNPVVLEPCLQLWYSVNEVLQPPHLHTFQASYLALSLAAVLLSALVVFGIASIVVCSLVTLLHAFLISIGSIKIIHWSRLSIAVVTALLYSGILIWGTPQVIIEYIKHKIELIFNNPEAAVVFILFVYVSNLISAEKSENKTEVSANVVKDLLGGLGKQPGEILIDSIVEPLKDFSGEDVPPQELIEFHKMPRVLQGYGLSFAIFGLSIFLDWMTPYRPFTWFKDIPWWEHAVNSLAYGFAFIGLTILGGCMIISLKFCRYLMSRGGKKN